MDLIIQSVLPIFALVVLGYSAGRFRWVADVTEKGLADFTFKLAIPALLFKTMATAELPETPPYLIWAAYFGSVLTGWLIMTALVPLVLRRPLVDSAPIAMSACFGNVVMVGIPLCLNAVGPSAAGPIAVIISLHSPVLWTIASTHLAITNRSAAKPFGESVKDLVRDLSRNTIIIAILAGTAWRLTGIGLHPVAGNRAFGVHDHGNGSL
ncbi:MAG: AEC family transporter, partial [Pseudomonadota bacterium]